MIGQVCAVDVRECVILEAEIFGESLAVSGFVGVRVEREKRRPRFDEEALLGLRIGRAETGGIIVRVVRRRALLNQCKTFRGVVMIVD